MRAARLFALGLDAAGLLDRTATVSIELFGSLALTGAGHGTPRALLLGLLGEVPEQTEPDSIDTLLQDFRRRGEIALLGRHTIPFRENTHLINRTKEQLPYHTNGMRFTANGPDAAYDFGEALADAIAPR